MWDPKGSITVGFYTLRAPDKIKSVMVEATLASLDHVIRTFILLTSCKAVTR